MELDLGTQLTRDEMNAPHVLQHVPWLKEVSQNAVLQAKTDGAEMIGTGTVTGTDLEQIAIEFVVNALENFDQKIPLIGAFLDWPAVDAIEREGVRTVVRWAFGLLRGLGLV